MPNDDVDPAVTRRTALAVLGAGLAAGCSTYGGSPGGTTAAAVPGG
ncbi:iron sulfur protein, partial [Amycolatopsis vancoresmycina DSM 44592]